ncbi:MAG: phage tail protein [Alphaproteobacteria bacterium]|nr:phage tail protein [Alphaproteobacteria bacterium]
MKRLSMLLASAATAAFAFTSPVAAQSTPYVGQLILVGYTFCPVGYAEAFGQLLPISQNEVLYNLYGTTYGGDGVQTFGVPDLRGRVVVSQGSAAGLPTAIQGQMFGAPEITLTVQNLPSHNHTAGASAMAPSTKSPSNSLLGTGTAPVYSKSTPSVPMNARIITTSGNNMPVDEYQPTISLRYCIATQGIYPSQN